MTSDNPFSDGISEIELITGRVHKRVDRCANGRRWGAEKDCPNDARRDSSTCSDKCAQEMHERRFFRFGVGTGVRLSAAYDDANHRRPVGGTRRPRELSSDGSGES